MARATGHWGPAMFSGPARLCLTSDELRLTATAGASLRTPYSALQGGAWRTGELIVHGAEGSVTMESPGGLDLAWLTIVARACPLSEIARGHRLLGSRRGGPASAQARLLAPLVQARRNMEQQPDLEVRMALFDARPLRERLEAALQAMARDASPGGGPERRALEAELEEAMSGLFRGIEVMDEAARHFREAAEPVRFIAWREWVSKVAIVFGLADSDWSGAARLLSGYGSG